MCPTEEPGRRPDESNHSAAPALDNHDRKQNSASNAVSFKRHGAVSTGILWTAFGFISLPLSNFWSGFIEYFCEPRFIICKWYLWECDSVYKTEKLFNVSLPIESTSYMK